MFKKVKIALAISLFAGMSSLNAQEFDSYIDSLRNLCAYDSVFDNLSTFESLGIKEPGTEALNNVADWIIERHQYFGYDNIKRDTLIYSGDTLFNIVVTKEGTKYPSTYLIVDGHYDTESGPGANDNGSGLVTVMEAARILKNVKTEYSIKFIYFTAEESGLVGSHHYVDNVVVPENMDIRLVFNIDEVGGVNGMSNTTITCERDEGTPTTNNEASAAFTDTLANCVELYSNLTASISYAYGSDYMPFEDNGEIITGLYEYNESPYPHSINDSISKLDMDYVFEVVKASTAATLYFSRAYKENTANVVENAKNTQVHIFPNPTNNFINVQVPNIDKVIKVEIKDQFGKNVACNNEVSSINQFDLKLFSKGMYFVYVHTAKGVEVKKVLYH